MRRNDSREHSHLLTREQKSRMLLLKESALKQVRLSVEPLFYVFCLELSSHHSYFHSSTFQNGTIIAPFILPFFNIPVVVEIEEQKYAPLDFFGLFGKNTIISFETIRGYLFTTENRQILVTVVGFYFGNAAAKNK